MNSNRKKTKKQTESQIKAEARRRPTKELLRKPAKVDKPSDSNEVTAQKRLAEQACRATDEDSKQSADETLRRRINLEIQICADKQKRLLTDERAKRRSIDDRARNLNSEKEGHFTQKAVRATHQPAQEQAVSEVTETESGQSLDIENPVPSVPADVKAREAACKQADEQLQRLKAKAMALAEQRKRSQEALQLAREEESLRLTEVRETPKVNQPAVSESVHPSYNGARKAIDLVRSEKGMVPLTGDSNIPVELLNRLNSSSSVDRAGALIDLGRMGGNDAFSFITKAFDDHSPDVRNAASRALYNLHPDRAASFTRALREGTAQRRRNIGASLASSGLASDAISNLLGDSREKTYDAFSLLFLMAKAGEVQPIIKAIEDHPSIEVRLALIKMLALSAQPEIVPVFRRLGVRAKLPSQVRSAVMEAIYQISSLSKETSPSAA